MELGAATVIAGAAGPANAVTVKVQNSAQQQQETVVATLLQGVTAAAETGRRLLAVA